MRTETYLLKLAFTVFLFTTTSPALSPQSLSSGDSATPLDKRASLELKRSNILQYHRSHFKTAKKLETINPERSELYERQNQYTALIPWATWTMLSAFSAIDWDRSGQLTWPKIQAFANYLSNTHAYGESAKALRPDEFDETLTGDCKAFSLYLAEFFRFWGWDSFVAGYLDGDNGHAVCLVKPNIPLLRSMIQIPLYDATTIEGDPIPNGTYIPIDYYVVGGFTKAKTKAMSLHDIFTPDKIWGQEL